MEQGGSKDKIITATTTKKKLEYEVVAKDLKVDTMHAMEQARCTFLKNMKEKSMSSTILELVKEVTNKPFVTN